jgi:hypothetical protein
VEFQPQKSFFSFPGDVSADTCIIVSSGETERKVCLFSEICVSLFRPKMGRPSYQWTRRAAKRGQLGG